TTHMDPLQTHGFLAVPRKGSTSDQGCRSGPRQAVSLDGSSRTEPRVDASPLRNPLALTEHHRCGREVTDRKRAADDVNMTAATTTATGMTGPRRIATMTCHM